MLEKETKLSLESAQSQLDQLYEWYDIDFDDLDLNNDSDPDERQANRAIELSKKKILKAIQNGLLEIVEQDNELLIKQKLRNGNELVYREITGEAKTAMNKRGSNNDHTVQMYRLLGNLCGLGEAAIKKLKGRDLAIAEAVGLQLLLA